VALLSLTEIPPDFVRPDRVHCTLPWYRYTVSPTRSKTLSLSASLIAKYAHLF
jgi:hypothetical protein